MKLLCVLLVAAITRGTSSQGEFLVEPNARNIVPAGGQVVLECVTREEVDMCAWKVDAPGLDYVSGFLNTMPPRGFTVRDPSSKTGCTIIIENVDTRYTGSYTCSPFNSGGQVDSMPAELIVAVKPVSVGFVDDLLDATELTASSSEPTSVTCEARYALPKADLHWFLEDRELTDGVEVEEETDVYTKLISTRSTLTHQFERQDDGATLRCEANHLALTEDDQTEASLTVLVQFAPFRAGGSDLGTLYGFTEGEDRDVTVNFTSNPAPDNILWVVGQDIALAGGRQGDGGRIVAGPLETADAAEHRYAVRLHLRPVKVDDWYTKFTLLLGNSQGQQELSVRVAADVPPPPSTSAPQSAAEAGLGGGAIGGIIVAVLILLSVIAVLAVARIRGRWCFAAANPSDTEASDTESAHDGKQERKSLQTVELLPKPGDQQEDRFNHEQGGEGADRT